MRNPCSFRELVALAESNGFHFVRKTKHGRLYERGRQRIVFAGSPGDVRSVKNAAADLQRLLREDK